MTWFCAGLFSLACAGGIGYVLGYAFPNRRRRLPLLTEAPWLRALVPLILVSALPFIVVASEVGIIASLTVAVALVLCGVAAGWYHYRVGETRAIGITGTIGSGKSLVGKLLADMGIPVIDTDHVVHRLLASDKEVHELLRARFGNDIFLPEGGVDRKKMRFVFKDEEAKRYLESVLHPRVRLECRRFVAAQRGKHRWAAVLVPLLFEAGLDGEYDEIWTVIANDEVVRARLKKRDGLTDEEVNLRLAAQFPQAEKARRSTRVLDNSGTVQDMQTIVKATLALLPA